MPFSHSTIGCVVADLQKRIHAYLDTLPDNYWVYLLSPIYSLFSLKVLIVVAVWVALSALCLCWMQGHAADDTCICNNMGLRKMRRLAAADSLRKGPLLGRRFSSVPPESEDTMETPTRSRYSTHSDYQLSWNSYSSSVSAGFSRNIASSSKATIWDSSYVDDTSVCDSEALLSGNPSTSCIIPLTCDMPESSTTRSFRDDTANISSTSDTPRQFMEASSAPQALDVICGTSDVDDMPTAAISVSAEPLVTETYAVIPTTSSSDEHESPAVSAPPRELASSQTLSMSRIVAEADHSQIMDESLDDLVVPPTPTPWSSSLRQAASLAPSELPVQPAIVSSASNGIQITVTAPERENESPARSAATPKPTETATPTPKTKFLSATTASSMAITPGRGRGPSFLPLPPTPVEDVKRRVPKASLRDSTNTAPPTQPKEKHWRKKKPRTAQPTADASTHSAGAPNWAAARTGNMPLIMRIQPQAEATPSAVQRSHGQPQVVATPRKRQQTQSALAPQPSLKKIKAEPPTEQSLLERLQVAPASAVQEAQVRPAVVKREPEADSTVPKPKPKRDVPNWAAEAAADKTQAQASSSTASSSTSYNRPASVHKPWTETQPDPERGGASENGGPRRAKKHRIVFDNGRWKRGTWPSRGPFSISTRHIRKNDDWEGAN